MFPRRHFAAAIAALAMAACGLQPASAQTYPSRAIKLILPFTPGSPNDVMARLLVQHLAPRLGQPIVIDNKPGGGTTIGTKLAAAAEPDGYTLLFISSAIIVDPAMKGISYDPLKEFTPVATVNTTAWLITVPPSMPVRTMPEFVAHTRAHPGTVNFAATQGTAGMLVAERFKQLSGADLLIVPYKGGAAAVPDFLGGRIQVLNPTPSTSLPLIREGKMRALMITSPARSAERARGRPAGADAGILGRRHGTCRNAARHRRQDQCSDQRHAALAGGEGRHGQARLRRQDRLAAGLCAVHRRGNAALGWDRQVSGCEGGVNSFHSHSGAPRSGEPGIHNPDSRLGHPELVAMDSGFASYARAPE
jgi:tripartite-type tricarboxylate transporter receptor subunit TctC